MQCPPSRTKVNKLFGASAYSQATDVNYEGAPSFVRNDEEALVRVLTTGTFEPTFYATDLKLAQEALAIFAQFASNDPHFLAQAILYARTEGLLRIAPITALVVLSASTNADAKELFRRIFHKVIQTPGDLQDFIMLCRQKTLRGMGKAVTHAAGRWLASISQYHAIKYGAESQEMSLRDIYRLTRPKLTGEANAIARWIVKGEVAPDSGLTHILGYERFKAAARAYRENPTESGEQEMLALIAEHRLPWEVVTSQVAGSTAVWTAMAHQMPYMALLRNLNNALKYGVVGREAALAYICATLGDPERVAKSKQLPFRFVSALKAIEKETGERVERLRAVLNDALELSFANMPELGARVLIANDISGSMSAKPSSRSDMTMAELAGIFAAAAFKKATDGEIVSFDTQAHPRAVETSQRLTEIAQAISENGGGTSLSAPLEYAFAGKRVYDVAIFLADSESWVDHLTKNRGALDLIREYRQRVHPALKCFFVQLLPYRHAITPQDEPDCYYLYGWNSSMLTFIGAIVAGGESQVEAVRQVSVL
jgi:60 kDa SS-A/Ro ribonucleoprotein